MSTEPCIHDVFVMPDLRRKRLNVSVAAADSVEEIRLTILDTPHTVVASPGEIPLEFPEFETWSPQSPHRYMLRCESLSNGEVTAQKDIPFAMREFTVKDERFFLNQKPCFLKGILHETEEECSLEDARRDVALAKAAGFNTLRIRATPFTPILAEAADEVGMLLCVEVDERETPAEVIVAMLRNHISIVMWCVTDADATQTDALCARLRAVDPSRLAILGSGRENKSRRPTQVMRPYRDTLDPCDDFAPFVHAPTSRETELYLQYNANEENLVLISGCGAGGLDDTAPGDAPQLKPILAGFEARELERVFGDFPSFVTATHALQQDAARHQLDAIRLNSGLVGYFYRRFADAGVTRSSGIVTRDRRPKPVHKTLEVIQRPARPVIQMTRTNLLTREEVPVAVTLLNEDRVEGRADLSLQVVGPTNQVLWKKKRSVKIPRHGKTLWEGKVGASGSPGPHRFVVRLMSNGERVAESSMDFQVCNPVEPSAVQIHVVDPRNEWQDRCEALAQIGGPHSPIIIVPPLANSVRAYPESLATLLHNVSEGAVALVFSPPDDWNALAHVTDPALEATSVDALGLKSGSFHYAKLHPIFEGLPSRRLMRQPYRNVMAPRMFTESSDEDIAGCLNLSPKTDGQDAQEPQWGGTILVRRFGSGRLVFIHLRILEHLGDDPLADQLFVNLINHFSRRSVPSESVEGALPRVREWLQRERSQARRWMVVGMFPNPQRKGHLAEYPPEREIDFDATYPGWYRAVQWQHWYSRAVDAHRIDLQAAFSPLFATYPRYDYGTGYAYAEFKSDRRGDASLKLSWQNPMRVWLNGQIVFEGDGFASPGQYLQAVHTASVRLGRNTVLIKCSKTPGPFGIGFDIDTAVKSAPQITWWK